MPKALHRSLARSASKQHLTGKRRAAYIYGTLNRIEKAKAAKRRSR